MSDLDDIVDIEISLSDSAGSASSGGGGGGGGGGSNTPGAIEVTIETGALQVKTPGVDGTIEVGV